MDGLNQAVRERANRNHTEVLRAMRQMTQERVAELMGVSPTTVSRMKDSLLPEFSALLAASGLKVVPETCKVYPPEHIAALRTLARQALDDDTLGAAE